MLFRPDPEFADKLMEDAEARRNLARAAQPAAELAKSFAPVRMGRYRDSITVAVDESGVYLTATDFAAHWVEWGSANNPPYAPLRRGAQGAGLRLAEDHRA